MQGVNCCKACAEKYRWEWDGPTVFSTCDVCKSDIFIKNLGANETKKGVPVDIALNPIKFDELRYHELIAEAEKYASYINTLGTFEYGQTKNLHNEALHAAKLALYKEINFEEIHKYEIVKRISNEKSMRNLLRNRYLHFRKIDDEVEEWQDFQ